ncbi:hypothetical protein HanRHA438_Chr15g0729761 [Helianthus annuus]|uniref:Uncharacterized protein n=1 Tax=Helianthus annuus TaxID=4232 RepID=A0A9K3E5R6_HELAN|nr:hypothetical protein HanXRQr2_Chr15g0717601 [Helianthus annuus]KAJ0452981.1 hypothetical protein HanHA300_Chr15g0585171 [Helianthus annuus]KAJ0458054.1 hypothetical protein HanIR_Chr15g0780741 [Helianthus annuus]KAJ0474897.1 hypothetical protein HanHA89_Chr15g0634951 [Helianthus annuus]KAJ0650452.1 hypothetical protein HanLR1_Chr15g0595871 [Helianthus annuus]
MSRVWFLAFSPFLYVDFFAFLKLVWSTVRILYLFLLIKIMLSSVMISYPCLYVSIEGSFVE